MCESCQAMTELPNLPLWHPAPIGATIPAGTPYALFRRRRRRRITVAFDGHFQDIVVVGGYGTYYTERPVTIPLPREEGTTILASLNSDCPPSVLLTREGERWTTPYDSIWYDYQIAAWAPVTIGNVVK